MRRLMLGMSQTTLGDALGLTFQQVQKYERGTNRIGASRPHRISEILQVPVEFFFEGSSHVRGQHDAQSSAPSPQFVSDYLATSDGLHLTKAFMRDSKRKDSAFHRRPRRVDRRPRGSVNRSIPHHMFRDMIMSFDRTDYSVVVKHRASPPKSWRCEIYRAGGASPVEQSSVYFQTMATASRAGKVALKQLLDKLRSECLPLPLM
jgi:transcriptional regulator with XRE-family HTH domain